MKKELVRKEFFKLKKEFLQTVVLVTHNIEEALFLGDKILVLSKRPAKIKSLIKVPFSNYRSVDVKDSQEFINLKSKIQFILKK